jgi:streptogramin lyase
VVRRVQLFIGRITPSGAVTQFPISAYNGGQDVTPGPDGNVWFTEAGGMVGYVTPAGAVTEFSLGSGIQASSITAGPDGAVWFTAIISGAGYVYRITAGGALTRYRMPGGADITTGPGRALVARRRLHRADRAHHQRHLHHLHVAAGVPERL